MVVSRETVMHYSSQPFAFADFIRTHIKIQNLLLYLRYVLLIPRKRGDFAVRDLSKLTRGRRGGEQVGASGCVVVKSRCVSVSLRTVISAA